VFPGGGVEEGETPEQAMIREIQEELSLQVTEYELLFEVFNDFTMNQQYPPRQEYYYLVTGFVGAIYNKDQFILSFNDGIFDPNFKTGTFASDQKFLENMCVFSLILEGIFFYSSFAVMFGFQRLNKMIGSAEQIQYIMRDESQHLNFGINMINTIKEEQPELWTPEFQAHIIDLVRQAVVLEYTFAQEVFPKGIFGMNADGFKRLEFLGLILAADGRKMSKRWGNVINPDDIVAQFGADAFRVYEMFMGPFTQSIAWNTDGVVGTRRFLEKVWKLQGKLTTNNQQPTTRDRIIESLLHKTTKKVEDKEYFRHSRYFGNLKTKTARQMLDKKPEDIVYLAVKGMLHDNKLRDCFLKRLKVFGDEKHDHEAQKPEVIANRQAGLVLVLEDIHDPHNL
jgi:hypothetical protein